MLFIKEEKVSHITKKFGEVVMFLTVVILAILFADLFFGIIYVATSGVFSHTFLEGVLGVNLVLLFLIVVLIFVLMG